jgi:hypothetical protein
MKQFCHTAALLLAFGFANAPAQQPSPTPDISAMMKENFPTAGQLQTPAQTGAEAAASIEQKAPLAPMPEGMPTPMPSPTAQPQATPKVPGLDPLLDGPRGDT